MNKTEKKIQTLTAINNINDLKNISNNMVCYQIGLEEDEAYLKNNLLVFKGIVLFVSYVLTFGIGVASIVGKINLNNNIVGYIIFIIASMLFGSFFIWSGNTLKGRMFCKIDTSNLTLEEKYKIMGKFVVKIEYEDLWKITFNDLVNKIHIKEKIKNGDINF